MSPAWIIKIQNDLAMLPTEISGSVLFVELETELKAGCLQPFLDGCNQLRKPNDILTVTEVMCRLRTETLEALADRSGNLQFLLSTWLSGRQGTHPAYNRLLDVCVHLDAYHLTSSIRLELRRILHGSGCTDEQLKDQASNLLDRVLCHDAFYRTPKR